MSRSEIKDALVLCKGNVNAAAQMIMDSKKIKPIIVPFESVGGLAKLIWETDPDTLFVLDLDDTTFSARGRSNFDPSSTNADVVKFDLDNLKFDSYFTEDMADFLRSVPRENVIFLTKGTYRGTGERMISAMEDSPKKQGRFQFVERVDFEDKLKEIEKLIAEKKPKRVVFFDDKENVFWDQEGRLRNIELPSGTELVLFKVEFENDQKQSRNLVLEVD